MLRHLSEIQYRATGSYSHGDETSHCNMPRRGRAVCPGLRCRDAEGVGPGGRRGRTAVAGAEVATIWDGVGGTAMCAFHAARADQAGRFTIDVNFWQGHEPFLAYNREHTRGGIVIWISRPREPERAPACRDFSSHVMRAPMKPAGAGTIQGSPATHLQTPPRDI